MNVTDDDGDILNTARHELVREADLNIEPGERMAVPPQVYPRGVAARTRYAPH